MKKNMKRTLLTMVLCATAVMAGAQNTTVTLDLDQAIQIALDDNPTIKIADLEIQRQEYVRKETLGNHLPQLSVNGSYTRAIVKSEIGSGISFEPDNAVAAQAQLNLPLFAPGVYKTLRMNEEQMKAAVEAARTSRITLVNEVKKAYYNILLAQQSLQVLLRSAETIGQTVDETRLNYENGLASEYDLITAEVQLSNLQPTIIQTENSIQIAKKLLKMYLNLPEELVIETRGDLNDFADKMSSQPLYGYDLTGNSDLREMDLQVSILEKQLQVLKTARMPTVGAFGTYSLSGRDNIDIFGTSPGGSSRALSEWTYPFSVGVQVSIPIFSGFTNTNREKQLKNNISQMRWQRDYLRDNVNVQLETAINNLMSAEATMAATSKTISQAQRGYEISKTRYNAEVGTILELNNAELQWTQARLNYTQAVYDFLSAKADYDKIIGLEH